MASSLDSFTKSPYRSIKQNSYFHAYDKVLSKYIGKSPVLVEVGILSGGSLFMWRDFFGPGARIIGIELNPEATKWRDHGFEVFIGDQSSDEFWDDFYRQVGSVDILIDDGGHTNFQQLKTLLRAIPNVRDGGTVLIEDTHASYMKAFGNPSKYSFMNFCASAIHKINDRYFYKQGPSPIRDQISSIEIFESLSVFNVERSLCYKSSLSINEGIDDHAADIRVAHDNVQASDDGLFAKAAYKARRKMGIIREKITTYFKCKPLF